LCALELLLSPFELGRLSLFLGRSAPALVPDLAAVAVPPATPAEPEISKKMNASRIGNLTPWAAALYRS
jgi:hypothetical protein